MSTLLALAVGALYAGGLFMVLRRNLLKLVVGIVLLGHAVNLLVFVVAGLVRGRPPLVPEGQEALPPETADPLPQALILTAIVINFGLLAFSTALVYRTYQATHTEDVDALDATER